MTDQPVTSASAPQAKTRSKKTLNVEDITVIDNATLKRAVAAAALGNAMEWFDFGVYSYIAFALSKVFFADLPEGIQLLATFATFAIAFLVRPLGGMFFGPLGDKVGRQKILAATMIIMAISTFCIGLIPSTTSIGIWAPILLLVARLVQGFSTGGEYGGAATFIAEYSPDRRRGFMGSWLEFGTLAGYVLGAALVTGMTMLVTKEQLYSWGWRIPFFIAGPLGLVGLYLRTKLEETPAFKQQEAQMQHEPTPKNEFLNMVTGHWKAMLVCIGLVLVFNVTDYMLLSYIPTYLSVNLKYDADHGLLLVVFVMLVMMVIQPFLGLASDRFGRKPIIILGCVGTFIMAIPCFMLIGMGSTALIFMGLMILGVLLNCFTSTMPSTLPALFPTSIRYGALAIAFNVSVSLFGGTTPLFAAWLVDATGNLMMPAFYMMFAAAVGFITILMTKETASKPLTGSTPAASTREEAHELLNAHREDLQDQLDTLTAQQKTLAEEKQQIVDQLPKQDDRT